MTTARYIVTMRYGRRFTAIAVAAKSAAEAEAAAKADPANASYNQFTAKLDAR